MRNAHPVGDELLGERWRRAAVLQPVKCGISFAIKSLMRFADLFLSAISGHAGPILINFDVTPVVLRISSGQGCTREWPSRVPR
jgi:hypothetical protein